MRSFSLAERAAPVADVLQVDANVVDAHDARLENLFDFQIGQVERSLEPFAQKSHHIRILSKQTEQASVVNLCSSVWIKRITKDN